MKTKITLIMNPSSRNGKCRRAWQHFSHPDFDRVVTRDREHLIDAARNSDADPLVAVGGDGTINLVANAILASPRRPRMGILYAGTSPDICRFHHIPHTPADAMQTLLAGNTKHIDVVAVSPVDNPQHNAYFLCAANLGLGPAVAESANMLRRFLGDTLGTFLAFVTARLRAKRFAATIEADGKTYEFSRALHIAILKSTHIASGIRVELPSAPDDGFLHIVVLENLSLRDMLALYRGQLPAGAFVLRTRAATVRTLPRARLEYDGDATEIFTPLTVACLQKKLEIIA